MMGHFCEDDAGDQNDSCTIRCQREKAETPARNTHPKNSPGRWNVFSVDGRVWPTLTMKTVPNYNTALVSLILMQLYIEVDVNKSMLTSMFLLA